MKLQNKLIFALGSVLLSGAANATLNFDLRHEYKPGSALSDGKSEQASRFKFGDNFKLDNDIGANLSLETKFKSDEPNDFMQDIYINEMELDMGLTFNLGGGWQLKPGMPINVAFDEPNDNGGKHLYYKKVTYKPQVRIQHNWKLGDVKWKNALRYRHEFADYRTGQGGDSAYDNAGNKTTVTNPQQFKVTLTGGLAFKAVKNLSVDWEANYWKSLDNVKKGINTDEDSDFDAGLIVGYKLGNWKPYVEAWSIKGPNDDNRRSAKYRIGLKYYWK